MKARVQQLAARYAALPRRERMLLPAALCFAILMLGHLLLIEPPRKTLQQLRQRHAQEAQDLTVAQAQLNVLRAKVQDPDAEARRQLATLRTATRSVDDRFRDLQGTLVPAQEMSQWLSGLMQAQRGLQLVGLRTLPATPVGDLVQAQKAAPAASAASGPAAASAPAAASTESWLYRHGVQVTVRGSYPELLAYLSALERMPRRVYWGELKLDAQDSPAVLMTVTVYTLSIDKTWWQI